jgi:hypothetical protein
MFYIGEVATRCCFSFAGVPLIGTRHFVGNPVKGFAIIRTLATKYCYRDADEAAREDSTRCIRLRSGRWNLAGGLHKFGVRRPSEAASSGRRGLQELQ